MNILNMDNSVLFKDLQPIPNYYMIYIHEDDMRKALPIIISTENIEVLISKLKDKGVRYNLIRIDEITHMCSNYLE